MILALAAIAAAALFVTWWRMRSRWKTAPLPSEITEAVDAMVGAMLEVELTERALGVPRSTPEERRRLVESLRGEPDPEVVEKLETAVRTVDLEFVRYAHEADAELVVTVRYTDGRTFEARRRVALSDVPRSVRDDFEAKKVTRVFRAWAFPWARARVL